MRIFIVKKKNYYDAYNFSLIFNERKKNNQKIVTSFIKGFVSTFFLKVGIWTCISSEGSEPDVYIANPPPSNYISYMLVLVI